MYAIVEIAGKQYRVTKDMKLKVPLLAAEAGKKVDFDRVLLVEDDKGAVAIGDPTVKNTSVNATVIEHGRAKKIIVFKKKRRKGYQRKRGHRQDYTVVEINAIGAAKAKPKETEKKPAAAQAKPAPVKKAAKTGKTTAAKKATTAPKKPAATESKKTTTKKTAAKPVAKTATTKKTTTKKTSGTAKKPVKKEE